MPTLRRHHGDGVTQTAPQRRRHRDDVMRKRVDVLEDLGETHERQPQKNTSNLNSLRSLSMIIMCY